MYITHAAVEFLKHVPKYNINFYPTYILFIYIYID